jgi:hypothetical protein
MSKQASLGALIRWAAAAAVLTAGLELASGAHAMSMTKVSGPYRITMMIGPAETMSMTTNGKATERMISGKNPTCQMGMHMEAMLAGVGASTMKTCNAHVEVHVYNKSSGKVVTNAAVTIKLVGTSTTINVPIMTMQGMHAGPSDFHYGNNIYAAAGKYTIKVTVNRVKANFDVTITRGM